MSHALRGAAVGSGEQAQREVESVQFADVDKKVKESVLAPRMPQRSCR